MESPSSTSFPFPFTRPLLPESAIAQQPSEASALMYAVFQSTCDVQKASAPLFAVCAAQINMLCWNGKLEMLAAEGITDMTRQYSMRQRIYKSRVLLAEDRSKIIALSGHDNRLPVGLIREPAKGNGASTPT